MVRSALSLRRGPLHVAAAAALWLLVFSAVVTFGFFFTTTFTRWYLVRAVDFIAWRSTLILQYNFANATTGRATPLLSGSLSFLLIWQWCATLAAALGAAGLLWLTAVRSQQQPAAAADPAATAHLHRSSSPSPDCSHVRQRSPGKSVIVAARKAVARAGRLLRLQVPPRGLWRTLLGPGGLSVLDLLLILLWFGLHIMWMYELTMRTLDNRRATPPPPAKKPTATTAMLPPSKLPSSAAVPSPANVPSNNPVASPAKQPSATTPTPAAMGGIVRRHLLQQQPSSSPPLPSPKASGNSTSTAPPSSKAPSKSALPPPPAAKALKPLPDVVQDSVSKYLGQVGRWDILLMFFPLPRCNFLHWLLGSDFPTLVKYHRWLGHGTILVYSLHSIIYMVSWTEAGTLGKMLNWGMDAGVNRLSGLVAMCGGWLIWLTCWPIIRRRFFNVFYLSHILGAVVFLLFGFMHRKDVATWIMPGIFLYLLDVTLRTIQQSFNSTRVSAVAAPRSASVAKIAEDGGVVSLTLRCDQSMSWCGSDIVFLNVPAVSWWQWHPFTVASASAPPTTNGSTDNGANKMILHIKKYNRWTRRFITRLATDATPLTLYVSGPYPSAHRALLKGFQRHIFIAGGIGVTPVLGMLMELIQERRAAAAASSDGSSSSSSGIGRVSFVWISRSIHELAILPAEVLQEANRGKEGWLDLQLYLTSGDANNTISSGGIPAVSDKGLSSAGSSEREAQVLKVLPPAPDNPPPITVAAVAIPASATAAATIAETAATTTTTDEAEAEAAETPRPASPRAALAARPPSSRGVGVDSRPGSARAAGAVAENTLPARSNSTSSSSSSFAAARATSGAVVPTHPVVGCVVTCSQGGSSGGGDDHKTTAWPLAHPYMFSPLLWMAAAVLSFAGGFAGLMCAQAYDAHMARTVKVRTDFSYVGMLQFAALGLGAVLPPAVLMTIVHIVRRTSVRSSARVAAHGAGADRPSEDSGTSSPVPVKVLASAVAQRSVKFADVSCGGAAAGAASIQAFLMNGRPDVRTLLTQQACQEGDAMNPETTAAADPCVGVFVAGPARLVAAVEETCASLNGLWGRRGRAFLQVKALTHEL